MEIITKKKNETNPVGSQVAQSITPPLDQTKSIPSAGVSNQTIDTHNDDDDDNPIFQAFCYYQDLSKTLLDSNKKLLKENQKLSIEIKLLHKNQKKK